jgi:hypothetical protein
MSNRIKLENFVLTKFEEEDPYTVLAKSAKEVNRNYLEFSQIYFGVLTYAGKNPNNCLGKIDKEALEKTRNYFLDNHKNNNSNQRFLPKVICKDSNKN